MCTHELPQLSAVTNNWGSWGRSVDLLIYNSKNSLMILVAFSSLLGKFIAQPE